ncbi:MAG: hypothetical protein HN348_31760, partial [Proteobacteria bacterium]|nr:hypothetical protein [Pseudomonadota bacterium]
MGHPTIIIGYGRYGRVVLNEFLTTTATRGVLAWKRLRGGARTSSRRLRDLELLWIPDPHDLPEQRYEEDPQSGSAHITRDLFAQVQEVAPRDLAKQVSQSATTLLSAAALAERGRASVGLDIIVIAQPTADVVLGLLKKYLDAALDGLASMANLEWKGQSSLRLNSIQLLDFDAYWTEQRIQSTMASYVEFWERRYRARKHSFARFYLMDGDDGVARRSEDERVEEVVLFLEFLLFADQRLGELKSLWSRSTEQESPVAAIGVRMFDRGSGLLARLAAARFGTQWMPWLAGEQLAPGSANPSFAAWIDELAPAQVDEAAPIALVDDRLDAVAREIASLSLKGDWVAIVNQMVTGAVKEVVAQLEEWRREQLQYAATTNNMDDLRVRLTEEISHRLFRGAQTVPIGKLLEEIRQARAHLVGEDHDISMPDPV